MCLHVCLPASSTARCPARNPRSLLLSSFGRLLPVANVLAAVPSLCLSACLLTWRNYWSACPARDPGFAAHTLCACAFRVCALHVHSLPALLVHLFLPDRIFANTLSACLLASLVEPCCCFFLLLIMSAAVPSLAICSAYLPACESVCQSVCLQVPELLCLHVCLCVCLSV